MRSVVATAKMEEFSCPNPTRAHLPVEMKSQRWSVNLGLHNGWHWPCTFSTVALTPSPSSACVNFAHVLSMFVWVSLGPWLPPTSQRCIGVSLCMSPAIDWPPGPRSPSPCSPSLLRTSFQPYLNPTLDKWLCKISQESTVKHRKSNFYYCFSERIVLVISQYCLRTCDRFIAA